MCTCWLGTIVEFFSNEPASFEVALLFAGTRVIYQELSDLQEKIYSAQTNEMV